MLADLERGSVVRIQIGDKEVELSWDNWEKEVREGRIGPDALVRFGQESYRPAKDHEAYRNLLASRRKDTGPPIATIFLVGVQIRIWMTQWVPDAEAPLVNWTILQPIDVFESGEVWRLLTMGLLHTDFLHIAFNLIWLAFAGWTLERQFGRMNLLMVYFWSVLTGSALSCYFSPWNGALGASGGVFGLIAASTVVALTRPEYGRAGYGIIMLPYMAIMFWSGLSSDSVANWAHFGGLITGLFLAFFIDPPDAERRPGQGLRLWRRATAALAAVLALFYSLGSQIQPFDTPEYARWHASDRQQPPAEPVPSALHYSVPAGWAPASLSSGELGFVSRAFRHHDDERPGFAVREVQAETPLSADEEIDRWKAKMIAAFPTVSFSSVQTATLAGRPADLLKATTEDRTFRLRLTLRGSYGLLAVEEFPTQQERHLKTIFERIDQRIEWSEPLDVLAARTNYEGAPQSYKTRMEWAMSLAHLGEPEDALPLWKKLLEERSSDPDIWAGVLKFSRNYPQSSVLPEDQAALSRGGAPSDALLARALQQDNPAVWVEVVISLEAQDRTLEAQGILDIAWNRLPGDRTVKRARKSRGLSTEMDPVRQLPWELAFDAHGQRRSEADIARRISLPLTLENARSLGQTREDQRLARAQHAQDLIYSADPRTLEALLRLKYGRIPEDPANAWGGIQEDIRSLARDVRPDWMPETVATAIRQQQVIDPLWFEDSPRWKVPSASNP